MSVAKGRSFWERLVREVEGGERQTEVAARHGVAGSTVGYWVRRLRRERGSAAATALVPVRISGEERRRFGVVVGGARVEFEEGTDPGYVAAVVRALTGC
jgi:transposase-like protein